MDHKLEKTYFVNSLGSIQDQAKFIKNILLSDKRAIIPASLIEKYVRDLTDMIDTMNNRMKP